MRIIPLKGHREVYTSNVYLVTGKWKRIADVNTLIDVGNDPSIIDVINNINCGVGKKKVEQVILTHDHSDHSGILKLIIKEYDPEVLAFSPFLEGATRVLRDGDIIRVGDNDFEIVHTPGHSSDSICLYSNDHKVLFVGDTPVIVRGSNGSYEKCFINALNKLCQKQVESIYFGHDNPVLKGGHSLLVDSLNRVLKITGEVNSSTN